MTDQPAPPPTPFCKCQREAGSAPDCPVHPPPASPTALSEVLRQAMENVVRHLLQRTTRGQYNVNSFVEEVMPLVSPALDALAREVDQAKYFRDLAGVEHRLQRERADALDADLAALRLRLTEAEQRQKDVREWAEQQPTIHGIGADATPTTHRHVGYRNAQLDVLTLLASRPVPPVPPREQWMCWCGHLLGEHTETVHGGRGQCIYCTCKNFTSAPSNPDPPVPPAHDRQEKS